MPAAAKEICHRGHREHREHREKSKDVSRKAAKNAKENIKYITPGTLASLSLREMVRGRGYIRLPPHCALRLFPRISLRYIRATNNVQIITLGVLCVLCGNNL